MVCACDDTWSDQVECRCYGESNAFADGDAAPAPQVDIEEAQEVAVGFGVRKVPHFVLLRDGAIVGQVAGGDVAALGAAIEAAVAGK